MTLGFQAAAGVDRVAAITRGLTLHGCFPTFSSGEEAQIFRCHDFSDREAVVNFRKVDVIRG